MFIWLDQMDQLFFASMEVAILGMHEPITLDYAITGATTAD